MSVSLNPEAKEFIPEYSLSRLQQGLVTINKTVKVSNNLPVGTTYNQFKSFPDFKVVSHQLAHIVFHQLNSLFVTEIPSVGLKVDDFEYNTDKVIDANDRIFDRIYNNIEYVSKGITSAEQVITDNNIIAVAGSNYYNPIVKKIKIGSATFTGGQNIQRPQMLFHDPVDNSNCAWIPKIFSKPNSLVSLLLEPKYNDQKEIVGFDHPYKYELSVYNPKPEWLQPDSGPFTCPPPISETSVIYVSTYEQFNIVLQHLSTVKEIAVDLENHSFRSFQGFTCLIQLTADDNDYIIDALALRQHLHRLNETFTNCNILKVFHGAMMDVCWLQRDFGVYVVGMFDTYHAARQLNLTVKSLAALLRRYCSVETQKAYQQADWRLRPLTDEMIKYARTDTHYLLYIYKCMKAELLTRGTGLADLKYVYLMSNVVCGKIYEKPLWNETSHLTLYQNVKKTLGVPNMEALKKLYRWRDVHAREADESPSYILPNDMLMSLAEKLPRDVQGIAALCVPMPTFIKQKLDDVLKILLSCREITVDQVTAVEGESSASYNLPPVVYHVLDNCDCNDGGRNRQQSDQDDQQKVTLNKSPVGIDDNPNEDNMPDITLLTEEPEDKNIKSEYAGLLFLSPYERYHMFFLLMKNQKVDKTTKVTTKNTNQAV